MGDFLHDTLLFGGTVVTAEAGDGRENVVKIDAGGLEGTIAEGKRKELPGFVRFEIFFGNQGGKLAFFLFVNEFTPILVHLRVGIHTADEGLNQVFLTAKLETGIDRFPNINQNFFVLAVGIVIFQNQHENVVDVDFDLPNEFHLEDDIVVDVLFFVVRFLPSGLVKVEVTALVILHLPFGENLVSFEGIEGGEDVSEFQNRTEERDKLFFVFFAHNRFVQRKLRGELFHDFRVTGVMFVVFVVVTAVVGIVIFQEHDTFRRAVAEERDSFVGRLLKISETDDISERLDGVQNPVRARVRLNQAVHSQVFIDPERVERGRVKARQEHIHDNQQVQLAFFHPVGNVLVIVLEFVGTRVEIRVETRVVVGDGGVQKVARRLVKCVGLEVFVREHVRIFLIRAETENRGDFQVSASFRELSLEFGVVFHRHRNGVHGKERVEPHDTLVFQHVGTFAPGFLVEMFQNVANDFPNPFRGGHGARRVDGQNVFILHIVFLPNRTNIVDTERQNVSVVDGIHNRVRVEFLPERLRCGAHPRVAAVPGIYRENRRAGESENVVVPKRLNDGRVHVAELTAVALVEDDDEMLTVRVVGFVFANENVQFLNRRDDDSNVRVFQLLLQDSGGRVAVGGTLFKAVVLLHRLVVQVLSIHHEEHFLDAGHHRGELGGLERGERFAASGRVPDVTARIGRAGFFVVRGNQNPVQNPFRGRDLVRTHDQKQVFGRKNAVPGQDTQNRTLCQKRLREIHEVGNNPVVSIRPERGKFKAVAGLFALFPLAFGLFADVAVSGRVGVIFRVRTVADDKNLNVFVQTTIRPEAVTLVTPNLVERFPNRHAPTLQFHVHERQTVHENRHIIPGIVSAAVFLELIDDLHPVIMDVLLVDEIDVFGGTIVPTENLHVVGLDFSGLLDDSIVAGRDTFLKEPFPLTIGKRVFIQKFELPPQVGNQLRLIVNREVFVPLQNQKTNELFFQFRLALERLGALGIGNVFGNDGAFIVGKDDVEGTHKIFLLSLKLLSGRRSSSAALKQHFGGRSSRPP